MLKFKKLASHHIGHKQHSPGGSGQVSRNSNLRVVIPTPMAPGGMSAPDDINAYGEVCYEYN